MRDVLMMSSGVKWNEKYTDPASDRRALLRAQIAQKPGGAMDVMAALPRAAEPGRSTPTARAKPRSWRDPARRDQEAACRVPVGEDLGPTAWRPTPSGGSTPLTVSRSAVAD